MGGGSGMEMRKWSWIVFPALVGITVVFSSRWLIAGPDQIWQKLWLTSGEVKTADAEVAKLKNKLAILNGVDIVGQKEVLSRLETAVPSQRRAELLIWEVTAAASESGVAVERYGAGGDETQQFLQVTLRTDDAVRFVDWVERMEKWLPLVTLVNVNYKEGRVEVNLEQEWKATVVSNAKPEDELPETAGKVRETLQKLSGYREVSSDQIQDVGGVNPNPF